MSPAATARRGRPRDTSLDDAILDAAIDELIDRGISGLTIEAVAERAGVARTTIYRRWPDTLELAMAATRHVKQPAVDPPAGSVRDQLIGLLESLRRTWNNPRYSAIMRRVAADGTAHPQLYRECRDRLVGPQIAQLDAVIRRGIDDGLIRADLDVAWIRRLFTGPVIAAAFTLRQPVTRAQLEASVDVVLRGVSA